MVDIAIDSWNELTDQLFDDSWNATIGRHRSPFVFRGLANAGYDLATSLMRLGGPYDKLERHLLRNFQKYAAGRVSDPGSFWHWLTLAQHHGLPTRLLDWTYSPYVAMHFATADLDSYANDGAIWMVDYHQTASLLPRRLARRLEEEGSSVFTSKLLDDLVANLEEFDLLARDDFVLFLEPPSIDERIVNQFALFSVMSNPRRPLSDWLLHAPELCRRLVIPAHLKWEIRDRLDQGNITERVLLPGLDGLSAWLRRHYAPRGPKPIKDCQASDHLVDDDQVAG